MVANAELEILRIDVNGRSRKHFGDVSALADSIERIGLLHPVVVTADNKLVVGRRRIEAFKHLGRTKIPARVVTNVDELQLLLEAERDENTCREAYTPEEAVHLGGRIESVVAKLAKEAQKVAGKEHGGDKRSEKAKQEQPRKTLPKPIQNETKRTTSQASTAVGMSRPTYERAKAVVDSGDRKLIDEMNRTGKVNGAHKKLVVAQKSAAIKNEPSPLPEGPFRVIACDPPWQYDARENDPSHRSANPYPSMSVETIKTLPVGGMSHDDCVLWLWTTNAHLPESFAVVTAWWFTYKTMLTWDKQRMGTGDWLRGQTEHCLFCVRGKPTIQLTNQTTLLAAKAGKHSAKPDEFYKLVEKLCPGSRLEMFQRTPREGWTGHGDESK